MADDVLLLVLQSIPNNQLWLNTVIYNYVIGLFCLLNNHLEQKYYSLISVMSLLHFSAAYLLSCTLELSIYYLYSMDLRL